MLFEPELVVRGSPGPAPTGLPATTNGAAVPNANVANDVLAAAPADAS
jgi:hypothetical protein